MVSSDLISKVNLDTNFEMKHSKRYKIFLFDFCTSDHTMSMTFTHFVNNCETHREREKIEKRDKEIEKR